MANKHISDELLAAYLEGNTNETETLEVLGALKDDSELREVLDVALHVDDNEFQLSLANSQNGKNFLPMMRLAAESGKNICSVMCETFVLHRRGISFDERELLEIAQKNDWLRPEGTPLHAIGQLLAHHGLMITHQYDASLDDIEKALSLDNDVIAVVDSDKLYPEREDKEDAPNHAVVVIAVDEKSVEVFDPYNNCQLSIVNYQFTNAWKDSHNYMVRVLQSVEEYDPQPINLEDIELTSELLELREAIAENAHDVWATARMKEGWTYGHERDDALKKHPDLIPYSALPDSEKEYDRLMALDTIRLVKRLGFEIKKEHKRRNKK